MGFLTKKKPKGLLKIGKYTILSHLYTQLKLLKVDEIFLCLGYHHNKIIEYCKKRIVKDSANILDSLKKKKYQRAKFTFFMFR